MIRKTIDQLREELRGRRRIKIRSDDPRYYQFIDGRGRVLFQVGVDDIFDGDGNRIVQP